jgi:putative hydrolase of the HAD superfamily
MALRAVVFDFDGLVVDTESLILRAWQEEYERHGVEFPVEAWVRANVGTTREESDAYIDELDELERLLGAPVDRDAVQERRSQRRRELMEDARAEPGVRDWVDAATRDGLRLAVASSSARWWVEENLARVGLADRFDHLSCADEVGAAKPDPAVYRAALEALGVAASEAVALEDSPPGVRAAKGAGLFCVAVPSEVTMALDFSEADLVADSLATFTLDDLRACMPGRP